MSKNFMQPIFIKNDKIIIKKKNKIIYITLNNITCSLCLHDDIDFFVEEQENKIKKAYFKYTKINTKNKIRKSLLGTFRTLFLNYIIGLTKPFKKKITLSGLGYKVEIIDKQYNKLKFYLGKSHVDIITIDNNVQFNLVNNSSIELFSHDKFKLGKEVNKICKLRKYNCFTGYGILDDDKIYIRKKVRKSSV